MISSDELGSAAQDPGPDGNTGSRRRRRWPFVVVVALALVGAVAAVGWYVWLPNWRPDLADGERYGVDVSAHQGKIDWSRVAADEITFAYLKATEGGDWVDKRFAENWAGVGRAGIDRGAYHFYSLCTPGDVQARHFVSVVGPDPGALPPALDLELAGNCAARPDRTVLTRELDAFLTVVEAAWGNRVLLYLGEDFEDHYGVRAELARPLWHLRFLLRPDVDGWVVWQLHGLAHVDGVEGRVDLNVMRGR